MGNSEENRSNEASKFPPSAGLRDAGTATLVSSLHESRTAIDRVIVSARKTIRIFDRDLGDRGYRDSARIQLLESFLLVSRGNRVQIVLHDARHLDRDCARLLALFRRHVATFTIRETSNDARYASDALVLADAHSYWHRLNQDQPRAVFALGDSAGAAPLVQRFVQILESSERAPAATVLGL